MGHAVDNNLTSSPGAPGFSSRHGNLQDFFLITNQTHQLFKFILL